MYPQNFIDEVSGKIIFDFMEGGGFHKGARGGGEHSSIPNDRLSLKIDNSETKARAGFGRRTPASHKHATPGSVGYKGTPSTATMAPLPANA